MTFADDYYAEAERLNLVPHWRREHGRPTSGAMAPYVWRWSDLEPLVRQSDQFEESNTKADRRSIALVNPGFTGGQHGTTATISLAVQMMRPGEVATAHRHTPAAIRFMVHGEGAYTVVDGERIDLGDRDLVLTPAMMWHDHAIKDTAPEPLIWLDALDSPLINFLQTFIWEPYWEDQQPVTREQGHSLDRIGNGLMQAFDRKGADRTLAIPYRWDTALAAIQGMRREDPYDGFAMEYANPLDGGHTLPTLSCGLQRLPVGTATLAHRHTYSCIYHVVHGEGETIVNGTSMRWKEGDIFVVPSWMWHEHANRGIDEALLFTVSDLPVIEAANILVEEQGTHQEVEATV